MSIKRYVFMLFGALILLLAMSQLFVAQYFKTQLQAELEQSSKSLSKSLVSVVIENAAELERMEFSFPQVPEVVPAAVSEVQAEFELDSIDWVEHNELINEHFEDEADRLTDEAEQQLDGQLEGLNSEIDQLALELANSATQGGELQLKSEAFKAKKAALEQKVQALLAKERMLVKSNRENMQQLREQAAREYQQRVERSLENIEIHTDEWLKDGRVLIIEGATAEHAVDGKDMLVHDISSNEDSGQSNALQFRSQRTVELPSGGANHLLERFSESVLLAILLTSVMALLLAYWLSHHVTEPLTELAGGHKKLAEGQFGIQLKEQGVKELKQILAGFNRMSQALAKLSKKEQQMSQQQHLADLGQITRGIAHSLRNPLHTLGLLSEQSTCTESLAEREKLNSKMQQKIALMDKSIQSLLTLSSNEVARDKAVPLNAIIQDILLELSITGIKPKVMFDSQSTILRVNGAESELRSILHAVMINAVEADPEAKQITIELSQDEKSKRVTITDWGKGIDPLVKEQIFKPHVTTKTEGSGMGIYIAKRLIESHYDGEIQFADNPQGGTIVTLIFGLGTQQLEQQADIEQGGHS
ncbi:histidine kinase [Shewanella halifaxensis HAW-EB4]|uniref:histidine kinase n=1 Tax=Shewanella halifaxensis (strain HAW-EB4) TaxID=458817 RepID=B0TK58_SHEHH|nr:HAMP domain-containing sensor histidine kinase [Shewanella halifaxensis]ABZ77077.1 histidine kinase [Shewanella halifaxensis HAW-EB4]